MSAFPIVLNKSHWVGGSTYRYRFGSNFEMGNVAIALSKATVYYSWRNITSGKGNNKFRIVHPSSTTTSVNLDITLPDGGYEVADINSYIRWYLITNGYYIQNSTTGEQTVYCTLRVNPSTYQVEWVSYPLPTSLPAGYTAGSAIAFPSVARGPQLSISAANANFATVIGFNAANYPASQQSTINTTGSPNVPVVSDINNVIITMDSVMNPWAPQSMVIHSFSQAGVKYSGLITSEPTELCFVPQQGGSRQEITIQLCDQYLRPIDIIDTDNTFVFLIKPLN